MQGGPTFCNGGEGESSFQVKLSEFGGVKVDGVIIYKRRKASGHCIEKDLREKGEVCADAGQSCIQDAEKLRGFLPQCGLNDDVHSEKGIDQGNPDSFCDDVPCSHRKNVMEHVLQSKCVSNSSPRRFVTDALPSAQGKDALHCCEDDTGGNHHLLKESSDHSGCQSADSNVSQKEPINLTNGHSFTACCERILYDIMVSEKFVSFCNFLCEHFEGIEADSIFNFSLINSRIRSGQYDHAPELFLSDVQKGWTEFEKIGEQMIHFAKSISDIAKLSYLKQIGCLRQGDIGERRLMDSVLLGAEPNESLDLDTSNQLLYNRSDLNTKPPRTEAFSLYKVCSCRKCGTEAESRNSLVCDLCEAMYHVSCIDPPIEEIPISWYCDSCSSGELLENEMAQIQVEIPQLLENEMAQIQGESPKLLENKMAQIQGESPKLLENEMAPIQEEIPQENIGKYGMLKDADVQIFENNKDLATQFICLDEIPDHPLESGQLTLAGRCRSSELCKKCGMGEREGMEMLVCGNRYCPSKYYHQRCLTQKQLNCPFTQWFCPSCLCRACLLDKDDEKIVLCDGCDDAYHIYCMVPPQTSVPDGSWYCVYCTIVIKERRKMAAENESIGMKRTRQGVGRECKASRSVDMLLNAAKKLNFEENCMLGKNM